MADKTIHDLIADVDAATEHLDKMQQAQREASRRETEARNTLNQAQKALDEALAAKRKQAPRNSDWWSREHRRQSASA